MALSRSLTSNPDVPFLAEPLSSLWYHNPLKTEKRTVVDQEKAWDSYYFYYSWPCKSLYYGWKDGDFWQWRDATAGFAWGCALSSKNPFYGRIGCFSNLFEDAIVKVHGLRDEWTFLWSLEITFLYREDGRG